MAEDIITALSRFPDLVVVARCSSFAYKGKAVDMRQVGKELGVDYVVEGSVRKDGNKLRIVSQLIDTKNGEHVWAERFDRSGIDPWALQDEVTGMIVSALTGEKGALKQAQYRQAWGKDATILEEYDYYLLARTHRASKGLARILVPRTLLPHTRSQGFEVVLHHFHDGPLVGGAPPVVAVDTADQHLAVVIDLHELRTAGGADVVAQGCLTASRLAPAVGGQQQDV